MPLRKHERVETRIQTLWDYFTEPQGAQQGTIADLSRGGALLRTDDRIEHQRWVRLALKDEQSPVWRTLVARVVRCENRLRLIDEENFALYSYGLELTHPGSLSLQDFDLILALSSRNLSVRSCRILNSKSSFLSGFLA